MDRQTVYAGALPRSKDFLLSQQNAMVALAKVCEAVFGTATLADGFACTPTTPASMNVNVAPGSLYQLENLEQTSWGSGSTIIPADTAHSIAKQGISLDTTTLGITAPGTIGFSQVYLIQVGYQDLDTGSTVLPYYNSSLPSSPYSGPANAGTNQNTVRKGNVLIQAKAGVAATTGTQVAPTADAGFVGLFTVTVANGASTISSGNIAQVPTAPLLLLDGKLPRVPYGVQNGEWCYGTDTGTVSNSIVATLSPIPSAYVAGMTIHILLAHDITGATTANFNGLGNKNVLLGGAALTTGIAKAGDIIKLSYDGTQFQLSSGRFTPGVRQKLTVATTIYVNPSTGSDSNDGLTAGTAFATLNKAYTYAQTLDLAGQTLTISCAAGNYTPLSASGPLTGAPGTSSCVFLATGTANLIQSAATGFSALAFSGAMFTFQGPWILSAGSANANGGCISSQTGAQIVIGTGGIQFGACGTGNHIAASAGGIVILSGSYTIQNISAGRHFYASQGQIYSSNASVTVTVTGNPAFSVNFAEADGGIGYIGLLNTVFTGTAIGTRYLVSAYGWIQTYGGGATYLPGNVAGSVSAGTYS